MRQRRGSSKPPVGFAGTNFRDGAVRGKERLVFIDRLK